jgi:DNA-binding NtrC family response regulator
MRRILLLDDEVNVLRALSRLLRNCFADIDLQIEVFSDPEQALLRSGETVFDVVISDYRMPAINGVDFLKTMKGIQPDAVRLVLSASTEFEAIMNAVNQAEVFRYIAKPWQEVELKEIVQLAFERHDQAVKDGGLADESRAPRRDLSAQELEAQRLEAEEPGITKVKWGPDGSVRLDE